MQPFNEMVGSLRDRALSEADELDRIAEQASSATADPAEVAARLHEVTGEVVRGDQRGRTIGFPTANLHTGGLQLPKDGVYSVSDKPLLEGTPAVDVVVRDGAIAGVRTEVDTFFDEVMVMTEEPMTRNNRLALLAQLEKLMNRVADISKLAA